MRKTIEGIIGILAGIFIGWNPFSIIWYYHVVWPRLLSANTLMEMCAPQTPTTMHYILLLIALAIIIFGIRSLITGVRQLLIDLKTHVKGVQLFGIIADIKNDALGNPFQIASVGVCVGSGMIQHFYTELKIGEQYDVGDFVCVKHFEGDINVLRVSEPTEIPEDIVQLLKYYPTFWGQGYVGEYVVHGEESPDLRTIVVNGARYNTTFTYDVGKDEGFYQGDSGAIYTEETEN